MKYKITYEKAYSWGTLKQELRLGLVAVYCRAPYVGYRYCVYSKKNWYSFWKNSNFLFNTEKEAQDYICMKLLKTNSEIKDTNLSKNYTSYIIDSNDFNITRGN